MPDEELREVVIRRDFAAEPERVWRAWTDPAEYVAWIWPPRFESTLVLEPRVGGAFHLVSAAAEMGVSGEFATVEEPTLLEFTWRWDGEDEQTAVAVQFARSDEGTSLTLLHGGFATEEARAIHEQGWNDCLDRLPAHLAG
jgi:uncharacterized protein YndB with AHSA1/START domain